MDHPLPQAITMKALFLEKRLNTRQKNFYCVFRGREIGIFTTWSACEQRIDGFSHSSFKGYSTLEAAIEAMRQAGIHEPILFHSIDESPQSTFIPKYIITKDTSTMKAIENKSDQVPITEIISSNSTLSLNDSFFDATFSKTYVTSSTPKSSFDDTPYPNKSTSESEISFNPTSTLATSLESLKCIPSESPDIHDKSALTEDTKGTNTICQKPSSVTPFSHDSNAEILSLIKKLSIKQDELAMKQQQELVQIKEQNASLQNEIKTLKEQNLSISSKLDQAQAYMLESHTCWEKTRNDLIDSTLQIKTTHSIVQQLDQQMKGLNRISNELSENKREQNNQSSIRLSNLLKENANLQRENEELRSQSSKNTIHRPVTKSDVMKKNHITQMKSSSVPSEIIDTEIHNNDKQVHHLQPSKSDSSMNDSDSEFELPPQHARQSQKQKENVTFKQNYLRIPKTCKNLLLGDSNMKNVQRKRLDKYGQTEIRTFRGASIKTLDNILQKCSYEYPQVRKVSLCIGTIDSTRNPINCEQIMEDYDKLITTTRKVFPSASICILSIPPQSIPKANKIINAINNHLFKLARRHDIQYSSCRSLWNHVESDGKVENGILYDRVHLTERGLSYLLTNVSRFFFRQANFTSSSPQDVGLNLHDVSAYPALKARDLPWKQQDIIPAVHDMSSTPALNGQYSTPQNDTYAMKLKTSTARMRCPPSYSATIATSAASGPGFAIFETFV